MYYLAGNTRQFGFLATIIILMGWGGGSLGESTDNKRTHVESWTRDEHLESQHSYGEMGERARQSCLKFTGQPAWSTQHSTAELRTPASIRQKVRTDS